MTAAGERRYVTLIRHSPHAADAVPGIEVDALLLMLLQHTSDAVSAAFLQKERKRKRGRERKKEGKGLNAIYFGVDEKLVKNYIRQ